MEAQVYRLMIHLLKKKREKNKKKQRDHIDLMESNDFTYKEYDE